MTSKKMNPLYFRLTSDEVRDNCIKTLFMAQQSSEEVLEVIVQPESRKRSLAQNRLYWLWITQAADEWGDAKEGVHYDFKWRFLLKIYYRDSRSFAAMCDSIKALQDLDLQHYDMIAKEVVSLVSTTKATDKQMSEYLDDIYRFCYAQGLFLLIPEDLAWVRD
ncbi:MAG: hypothetical protein CMJ75_13975 [Planctomycetaceae bacterium]|nr:hypothetical protein [Planctomycetaceae bacterium]